jgi:uncharacterized protein YcfL
MKNLTLILISTFLFVNCRPQLDVSVTDSSVLDYNFNGFITEKSDTIKSETWVNYELYLKPISTSLLREVSKTIIVKTTLDKDLKVFYQLFDLEGKAISSEQRTGDISTISSEQLINNKCFLRIKVLPPNELGKFSLSVNTTWNGVSKGIVKSVVVVK